MLQSRLLLPSPPLRPFIHHYWVMRADAFPHEMSVMPRGCAKWIFHRLEPFTVNGVEEREHIATVCGQYHTAARISASHPISLIFVVFQPYAMKMVMGGMPCRLFYASNVDMESLGMAEFKDLKCRVRYAADDGEVIALIEDFVARQLARSADSVYLPRLQHVSRAIEAHPALSPAELADMACLSERQFRRVFEDHVGMSPKRMLKVTRFLRAARSIQELGDHDFTDIVYGMGYTDHSHFNKDFREFAGMSPTEYLQHVRRLEEDRVLEGYRTYHL